MVIKLNKGLDLSSDQIFLYRDKLIIDKNKQVSNRKGNDILSDLELVEFFIKAIDGFLDLEPGVLQRSGEDIIFSKSMKQGMIIEWRELYDGRDSEENWNRYFELQYDETVDRHFTLISFLPRNKSVNSIVVPYDDVYSREFCDYVDTLLDYYGGKEDLAPEFAKYSYNPIYINEINSPRWVTPFQIIFCDNRLWDFHPWSVVEVE